MKTNHEAVFSKAGNLVSKIALIFLIVSIANVNCYAQSLNDYTHSTAYGISQKGPFNMGEDEALDASPPVISYTPLTNTCSTSNRTLTATITDADGVPTSGTGLPVLYWKINSGPYTAVTGAFIGSNQYTFTFGAGTFPSNLVSYYIVAQDNAGNVIAKPAAGASGYSTNPPNVTTSPSSPDFYSIPTTLAPGSYNVGVGQTYVTLTDAVNAYNNSCLSGPVVFVLTDGAYNASEVFPITINNPAASSSNTLTIKPNTGINAIIQGSASDAIIKFNGSDYVTIDGSNSGGTTRNLSIINDNTGLTSNVIWIGSVSASNGATHNTIKNCSISGNGTNTTFAGIVSSSAVIAGTIAETANSDNTYSNNSITTCYYGMLVIGPAGGESNTVISGNTIGSAQATKKLGYRGLFISNETNIQVTGNTILGISSSFGIGSDTDPTGGVIVSGAISGGVISSNLISDIKNSSNGGWPAYGICLQSTSTASGIKLVNNMINSTVAYGNSSVPGNNGIGIALQTGGGYGIYFNSINLFQPQISVGGGISSCIFIGSAITGTASVDIRNNILYNQRTSGINYGIYSSVPSIIFSNINYNDYYGKSFLGFLGVNRLNIAAWQAATGSDGNSVSVNPVFVSNTDLHIQLISPLNDQGSPIAGITTDIDAVTRSVTVPDIGADEITPPVCSGISSGGTAVSDFYTLCTSGTVSLSASGFSYGLGIAYQWEKSIDNLSWSDVTGETNPTSSNPPSISVTTYYRLRVKCASGSPGYSNTLTITVYNPSTSSPVPGARCGPGTVNLAISGTAGTSIQWYTAATGGAPIYTGNPFTTPSIAATTTYYAESTYLGSSGTVGATSPASEGGMIGNTTISWDVSFKVIQPTKLLTVDVYPIGAGENSTIDIYSGISDYTGGILIASVPYTTLVSGGNTAQTVSMNVALPIGNYYLYATAGIPASGLTRNNTNASYPYNSSDIQITGNGFDLNYYMCYYNWRFSNGCSSSPRTPVVATVGVTATINVSATPTSICAGNSSTLNATSSNSSFVYTWTPGPFTGPSLTVSPVTTTTYTVNGTDGTCTATNNITVTVNPASSNVVISPATAAKCLSAPAQLLSATGGDIVGVPILTESFEGATNSWTTATPTSGGTAAQKAASAWTLRPYNYSIPLGYTFRSNDNSQFYLSNSDANPAVTGTTLTSPAFSLVGFNSANLSFWHNFEFGGFATPLDSGTVEISQNGSTWTMLVRYKSTQGSSINFANVNLSLNAYIGQPTNYVRFRYYAKKQFFWAIDNVSITGANTGSPITWGPLTGLYTDAAATIAYTGTATVSVYAKPSVTTTYTATASPPNGCNKTQTIDVTVRKLTDTLSANPAFVCPSGASTVSIALYGTGPWNLTYTDGVTPVTVNNIAASPYTFVVNPLITTTYKVTALSDAFCTATPGDMGSTTTVNVNPSAVSTWLGFTNVWTTPSNWCGGVPTSIKDVVIPVTGISPVITGTTAVAHDISISNGASITIDPGGQLSATGNFVNNGSIINNGTIVLNGTSAQSFPGGTTGVTTAMNNLEVNNAAGATINKPIILTGTLKPTSGNITLNNVVVTLHSDATGTAQVSALGATAGFVYTGTGKFSVERFISSATKIAWRFLSAPIAPLAGGQTINQAWQEGQAAGSYTSTGYGTQIVGPGGTAVGFDLNNVLPSLKTYNPAGAGSWVSVTGTNIPISTAEGYMTFVRGDRGSNTFGAPPSATTLRMAGQLKTGNIGPISGNANEFISVGNPYASAIDFSATTRNGLIDTYYIWDPKMGTYGAYRAFTGPAYTSTPTGYSGAAKLIESGQAFFVKAASGAGPHNISFGETNKTAGSNQVQRPGSTGKQLRTQLYSVGSNIEMVDGTLIEFDPAYSNDVDDLDAPKLTNFGENIGILKSGGSTLIVERHAEIVDNDTIFFQLGQLRQQGYQLEFIAQNLSAPGLTAYLEDAYLHTSTTINLDVVSTIDFIVNADAGSKASDRFRLVFKQVSIVPVTFTTVNAYRQDKNIMVSWKVENELNIDHYDIERSIEGRGFSKLGTKLAIGNNGSNSSLYKWLDVQPFAGDNFYRIKSVGIGNDIKYSQIVKVNMAGSPSLIAIYPNPVKDGFIGISFIELPKGEYDLRLFNTAGQLVLKQNIDHPGGSQRTTLPVRGFAKGIYNLEIIKPGDKRSVYKVIIE